MLLHSNKLVITGLNCFVQGQFQNSRPASQNSQLGPFQNLTNPLILNLLNIILLARAIPEFDQPFKFKTKWIVFTTVDYIILNLSTQLKLKIMHQNSCNSLRSLCSVLLIKELTLGLRLRTGKRTGSRGRHLRS